jgi:hypothetical protein
MKEKCIESLSTALTSASHWRQNLDEKWPDYRNARAARLLAKLAGEVSGMTDSQWAELQPYFGSPAWGEALKQVARMVGFHRRRVSFAHFLRTLARLLEAPATAA